MPESFRTHESQIRGHFTLRNNNANAVSEAELGLPYCKITLSRILNGNDTYKVIIN